MSVFSRLSRLVSSCARGTFDFVVPPRRSELIVRELTRGELAALRASAPANERFAILLPYRDERVRALVWELKYHHNRRAARLAADMLAEELLGAAEESLARPLLIPMPMHPHRRRERGRNQTETLCEAAIETVPNVLVYAPEALKRVRLTSSQQGLPRRNRLTNVRGSMEASPEAVRGRDCVIIDDVTTTGATFEEALRALRAAGAAHVHCLALAG